MKIALVHDYLDEFGGAERVLLVLSRIFPNADIYTIYCLKDSPAAKPFSKKKVFQSWFSHVPFKKYLISPFRFLLPLIWSGFDFSKYDLVITSSAWAVTKGMKNAKKEISYIHTPPRYLYGYETSRRWSKLFWAGAVRLYAIFVNHFLRIYDFKKAQEPDVLVANSKNVKRRIEKFYRRDSVVIYPPIEYKKFSNTSIKPYAKDYYLTGGRLVAHKNFVKLAKIFAKVNGDLIVFGDGLERNRLQEIAQKSPNIKILGRVSDRKLVSLYRGANAFIAISKDEDLGMTPLEAASAGTPTIAYKSGGYLETVIAGKTGVFIDKINTDQLKRAINKIESTKWDKRIIKAHARKFSKNNFEKKIKHLVKKVLKENK